MYLVIGMSLECVFLMLEHTTSVESNVKGDCVCVRCATPTCCHGDLCPQVSLTEHVREVLYYAVTQISSHFVCGASHISSF